MRLYIDENGKKIYLRERAQTRNELKRVLGARQFQANGKIYTISSVKAEPDNSSTTIGAGIGGLVGAFGGMPGVIAGALIGGAMGNAQLEKDKRMAEAFNASFE